MRVLLIGGSGVISTDVCEISLACGHEVTTVTRGIHPVPEGVEPLICDIRDTSRLSHLIKNRYFDVVADFISFDTSQLLPRLDALRNHYSQYIFISSCAVYDRGYGERGTTLSAVPPYHGIISEDHTPTTNFGWDYARNKIACEHELMKEHFLYGSDYTIVRPAETYNRRRVPGTFVIDGAYYTQIDRILRGKPTILHDDGMARAPFTYAEDFARAFVGLYGNTKAFGQAFHITTDELITWKQITETIGRIVGIEPCFKCIPSEVLCRLLPRTCLGDTYGTIYTSKRFSVEGYSNKKIKEAVPGFECRISFEEGIRRVLEFYDTHPAEKRISVEFNAEMDRLSEWNPK